MGSSMQFGKENTGHEYMAQQRMVTEIAKAYRRKLNLIIGRVPEIKWSEGAMALWQFLDWLYRETGEPEFADRLHAELSGRYEWRLDIRDEKVQEAVQAFHGWRNAIPKRRMEAAIVAVVMLLAQVGEQVWGKEAGHHIADFCNAMHVETWPHFAGTVN